MKQIWIFVLIVFALLMCVGAAGAEVNASGTCGKNGDNLIWTLEGNTLTITGTGEMADYEFYGTPWYEYCDVITNVVIEPGVTTISQYSFFCHQRIVSVTLPATLTCIPAVSFYACSDLLEIVIPEGVNEIGDNAFSVCVSLESVTLPTTLQKIGFQAFYDCDKLNKINIPEGMVEICESAFYGCKGLASLTLPTTLRSLGRAAFSKCEGLKELVILEGMTVIGESAFADCVNLASVVIHDGMTEIGESAFTGCVNLASVTLPKTLRTIGTHAFERCGLTELVIPEGVIEIGEKAFEFCNKLVSVKLPATLRTLRYSAFGACENLKKLVLSEGMIEIGDFAFLDCYSLVDVTLPKTLQKINTAAFNSCTSLKKIEIPESVTEIYANAFMGCADDFTIYGVKGSYAQRFAEANGIPFKEVGSIPREIRILRQPENVTVPQNTNAAFSIQVESGENYRYQWAVRRSDGVETQLDGEVYGTLTVRKAQYAQNGNMYTCYVTAPDGRTVRSDYATLTVVKVPKTGDTVNPYALIAIGLSAAAVCAVLTVTLARKRKKA